jgi:hypothetical protein
MHASFFFLRGRRCTHYALLIVVVEILRFGASAAKPQDDQVKEEGRHDGKGKSSGTKPMPHKNERTA